MVAKCGSTAVTLFVQQSIAQVLDDIGGMGLHGFMHEHCCEAVVVLYVKQEEGTLHMEG